MDEVEKLILSLKSGWVQTRRDSAYLLGEKRDSRAIPGLTQALQDDDEYVRERARDSLRQLNVPDVDKEDYEHIEVKRIFQFLSEKPALSLILGICILSLGTIMFKWPLIIKSSSWPTVEGIVNSSEVEGGVGTSDYDSGWWPRVNYSYKLDGKTYTADNIELIDVGNGNTDFYAKQIVEGYPVGMKVLVHYNPNNPANAVLEPGFPTNIGGLNTLVWIAFQVAAVVIGLRSLWVGMAGVLRNSLN